ncbi:MAG: hypothetical protein EOP53_13865 [Sphingobacteriales bacterium]|nr:MAG: hypothetical protein EOP53_13865 [Sphingobacteriales bacterium]
MKLIFKTIVYGGLIGIAATLWTFLFDGIGNSRVSGYFSHYHGSMSYNYYRTTFRPVSSSSVEDWWWKNLKYGSRLEDQKVLKTKILASDIPVEDIELIFYDTVDFPKFSTDSIYAAWVGLRSNYFSFLFRDKYAFEVVSYNAYSATNVEIEPYETLNNWKAPLQKYALVCLLLVPLFMMSMHSIFTAGVSKGITKAQPLLFIGIYAAAQAYISDVDYEHNGWNWFATAYVIILLGFYIYAVYDTKKTEDAQIAVEM